MKGKIRYYGIVEQDVEFPDRLIEIQAKGWDATDEEWEEVESAIEAMVDHVRATNPDAGDILGIYYGDGLHNALAEF